MAAQYIRNIADVVRSISIAGKKQGNNVQRLGRPVREGGDYENMKEQAGVEKSTSDFRSHRRKKEKSKQEGLGAEDTRATIPTQ